MMGYRLFCLCACLLLWTGSLLCGAGPVGYAVRTVCSGTGSERVVLIGDCNGDGLKDVLVAEDGHRLLWCIQSVGGHFAVGSDRPFALPEDTLWYALRPHSNGCDAVVFCGRDAIWRRAFSTGGWEAAERLADVEGLPDGLPAHAVPLAERGGLSWCPRGSLPIVRGDRLLFLNDASPGAESPAFSLTMRRRLSRTRRGPSWSVSGSRGPRGVVFSTEAAPKVDPGPAPVDPEFLSKALRRYKESRGRTFHSLHDVGGDEREDLIVYSYRWGIDPKMTLIMFFRGDDGAFSEKPDRILRARGVPLEWDHSRPSGFAEPFYDVNGDGRGDLLLVEMETHAIGPQSMLRAFLTESVEWKLTVRFARVDRSFSRWVDWALRFGGMPPFFDEDGRMVRLSGDFDGDGKSDLLVRRSTTDLEVYLSSGSDREPFGREPGLRFRVPIRGAKRVLDLNGDGCADVVCVNASDGAVSAHMSMKMTEE